MWKWKWAFLFVFIASAIVAMAYEQHYAREKYHAQSEADCIALSVSPEEKHSCAKEAQSRKDYAPWGYVLVAWPEGITTWAIIVTFVFIGWQADETRKAAKAAADSVLVQEVQYKQWAEIGGWRDFTPKPIPDDATLALGFEVKNTTNFPFTLKHLRIKSGIAPDGHAKNHLIAPRGAHDAVYLFEATPAELELYKLNQLIIILTIEVVIKDVLGSVRPPQIIRPTIMFGPERCETIGHTHHFQGSAKKTE